MRKYHPITGSHVSILRPGCQQEYGTLTAIKGDLADVTLRGGEVTLPLADVIPPIGWMEYYTITVGPDKLQTVLDWIRQGRGITVRACHDLSRAGRLTWQPGDNDGCPHWAYPEVADRVPPAECQDRIAVELINTEWDPSVPVPCNYCGGTGIRTATEIHVPHAAAAIGDQFPCCACTNGSAKRYLSQMDKAERKHVIRQWRSEGWTVQYNRRQQAWWRERTTVIKRHGEPVS